MKQVNYKKMPKLIRSIYLISLVFILICIFLNVYYLLHYYVKSSTVKTIVVAVILLLQVYFVIRLICKITKLKKETQSKAEKYEHGFFSEN